MSGNRIAISNSDNAVLVDREIFSIYNICLKLENTTVFAVSHIFPAEMDDSFRRLTWRMFINLILFPSAVPVPSQSLGEIPAANCTVSRDPC